MVVKDIFIRNIHAEMYRENFLISSVVSVFIIRIFLKLTNYPQLGHGNYHIAHMLWGGFFMLAAIIFLISFLSQAAVNIASVLGGIGFGAFIDELGKFITSDNDYFFQPSVALIYIVFVLIFLILKFIPNYRKVTRREYLVNTIEMIKEAAINDFDIEEEKQAKEYLNKCDPKDPIVPALKSLMSNIEANPSPPPGIYTRVRVNLRNWYYTVARSGYILNGIIVYLAFNTLRTLLQSVSLFIEKPQMPFYEWGQLYSSTLAAVFVVIGLMALRFSRAEAYRFFRIAMLITILLTEFFAFMHTQWYELIGLAANIFILMVINYAMALEKQKQKITAEA